MALPESPEDQIPSRTQRKNEALAMQELGKRLTGISESKLLQLPLTDEVLGAIREFKRLPNSHGARKRQLQFIGAKMRDCDFDAVTQALNKLSNPVTPAKKQESKAEILCQGILESGDRAINTLLSEQPQYDRQKLRQLHRTYSKAIDSKKASARKKLLGYIQELQ